VQPAIEKFAESDTGVPAEKTLDIFKKGDRTGILMTSRQLSVSPAKWPHATDTEIGADGSLSVRGKDL
jgi:hypothetical protein